MKVGDDGVAPPLQSLDGPRGDGPRQETEVDTPAAGKVAKSRRDARKRPFRESRTDLTRPSLPGCDAIPVVADREHTGVVPNALLGEYVEGPQGLGRD